MLVREVLSQLSERVRPALHAELNWSLARAGCLVEVDAIFWPRLERTFERERTTFPRTPELRSLADVLLRADNHERARVLGCTWLGAFPSVETMNRLAALLHDAREPDAVRNEAARVLGRRTLVARDELVFWTPETVAAADAALVRAARWPAEQRSRLPELAFALRSVTAPEWLELAASAPLAHQESLEAFASPALGRALLAVLPQLAPEHGLRLVRLVGQALGAEAAAPLLAYAAAAPPAERETALMTALALDAAQAEPLVATYLAGHTFRTALEARCRLQRSHPGRLPLVEALAVARTTATIAPSERAERCATAASAFAAAAAVEPFAESYLFGMWRGVAIQSADANAIAKAIDASPDTLGHDPRTLRAYLDALAATGRFRDLRRVTRAHGDTDHAVLLLARYGRPYLALATRDLLGHPALEGVVGEALASFLAGRPDLAEGALATLGIGASAALDADQSWLLAHAPPEETEALRAAQSGVAGLLALCRPAPEGADPDEVDLSLTRARRTTDDLAGAAVYLAGTFANEAALASSLEARGARIVSGPFAGTHFYVAAPDAKPATLARLDALGARRIDPPH